MDIDTKISISEIMKENTSDVIKKMESQIPLYIKLYSDYYREYLHMVDDVFRTCYISEKEFIDNLNLDQNLVKAFTDYSKTITDIVNSQIEISTNLFRNYLQLRMTGVKNFDNAAHLTMKNYSKLLSELNGTIKK